MADQESVTDFTITRNSVDDDQDDGGIALGDWEALIASDSSLEPVPHVWGRNPQTGERLQVPLLGGARWTGHPHGGSMPFWWHHGKIVSYSVDALTVEKARELAGRLGAGCIVSLD